MRILSTAYLLVFLLSCANTQTKDNNRNSISHQRSIKHLEILAVDGKLPLYLGESDLENNNSIQLNDKIVSKIEEVIKDYAKDLSLNDSAQIYKDIYINTIRMSDSLYTIFLVLLKHYPTDEINSKVLFYDNQKKECLDQVFDYNLSALYNYHNGKLIPSNLKATFKIDSPEIEVVDYDKDKINDFKFVRLWHNGTFNAIHTTVLTLKNNKLDTLFVDKTPIGNEELIQK